MCLLVYNPQYIKLLLSNYAQSICLFCTCSHSLCPQINQKQTTNLTYLSPLLSHTFHTLYIKQFYVCQSLHASSFFLSAVYSATSGSHPMCQIFSLIILHKLIFTSSIYSVFTSPIHLTLNNFCDTIFQIHPVIFFQHYPALASQKSIHLFLIISF